MHKAAKAAPLPAASDVGVSYLSAATRVINDIGINSRMNVNDEQRSLQGIQKYCDLLEELKLRIKTVQSIVNGDVSKEIFGHYMFADEFMFLQIRKILELIVFGSMASNISLYEKKS